MIKRALRDIFFDALNKAKADEKTTKAQAAAYNAFRYGPSRAHAEAEYRERVGFVKGLEKAERLLVERCVADGRDAH